MTAFKEVSFVAATVVAIERRRRWRRVEREDEREKKWEEKVR